MDEEVDYRAVVHYKTYPRFPRICLEETGPASSLGRIIAARRTRRESSGRELERSELHSILAAAAGRTGGPDPRERDLRAYPSAGARYPLELYLFAFRVGGLESGMYHFCPRDGSLEVLLEADLLDPVADLLGDALECFRDSALAYLVVSAIEERTTYKYGEEGRRFPLIEAGYMGANLTLLLGEAWFNTVDMGTPWSEEELGRLLDLNPARERVIASMAVL